VEKGSRLCPSCGGENEETLKACSKCGALFEEKTAARTFSDGITFAVALVLVIALIPLSKNLIEFFFGPKGSDGKSVLELQEEALGKASGRKNLKGSQGAAGAKHAVAVSATPKTARAAAVESARAQVASAISDIGGYHILVTVLPEAQVEAGANEYVEGLIRDYLESHDGSTLLGKSELTLQEKYHALEYRIERPSSKDGVTKPFIRYAITTLVAGKAYTVSVNYARGFREDDVTVRKKLLETLPKF